MRFTELTPTQDIGNTNGMKVAVSIPDAVFAETEDLAKQLGTSRSEIYSRALSEFLGRHAPDRVTELMNQAIAAVGAQTDPFVARAARRALRRVEW
jgi:metal-responsive CopG/Arc/MetJ family transcriptional regulator